LIKRRLGPCVTFFPQPTTLLTSVDAAGKTNLMTASWVGVVSKTPPTMAVSLHRERQTLVNIRETGCFVVNVVPASLMREADFCGLRSGRQVDKLPVTGLTLKPAAHLPVSLIDESPLNIECRLSGEVKIGDYRLLLGEIVEVHAADEAFDAAGSMQAQAIDPLVYLGGIREYWGLGARVGTAYRDGLDLAAEDKEEPPK